jgi:hypothetical protein
MWRKAINAGRELRRKRPAAELDDFMTASQYIGTIVRHVKASHISFTVADQDDRI